MSTPPQNPFGEVKLVDRPRINSISAGWTWDTVIPGYYNLWYLISGSEELEVDGHTYPVTPGAAFIFHPGQRIRSLQNHGKPLRNLAIHFRPLKTSPIPSEPGPKAGCIQIPDRSLFEKLARELNLNSSHPGESHQRYCLDLSRFLISHFWHSRLKTSDDPLDTRIMAQVSRIDSAPHQPWDVATLALELGLSPPTYFKRFKRLMQKAPIQYVITRRIDKAKDLLDNTTLSISEIADLLGYSEVYFFSRQFKQHAKQSPKQYRGKNPLPR
jgi:AraC-like DNA-binding protein